MVVLSNQVNKITGITLYSAITSATTFHLLVKCVLLLFIIWVVFKWEQNTHNLELPSCLNYYYTPKGCKIMDKRVTGECKRILDLTVLHITYKQKSAVISIICILAILVVWFLKKYRFYSDDLFFMGIILVIWVYAWRQNNTIAGFLSNLTAQSQDILLPIPGTDILSNQGLKAAPVTPSADTRSGILPEHYDYLPDDMKRVSKPAAFNPSAPIASSDELPQFNRMINLMEPTDHPVYKLTNEVLTALDNKCLAHDSTDTAKPMTEFMRQNGAGQSKWAFIEESEQQAVSAHNIPWSRNFNYTPHHTDNPEQTGGCNKNLDYAVHEEDSKRPPKSLDDKIALMEMFSNSSDASKNKYDTHEYSYFTDSANKKYPGVNNHCSLLGKCTNVNLPNAHSLNIIATNKIHF